MLLRNIISNQKLVKISSSQIQSTSKQIQFSFPIPHCSQTSGTWKVAGTGNALRSSDTWVLSSICARDPNPSFQDCIEFPQRIPIIASCCRHRSSKQPEVLELILTLKCIEQRWWIIDQRISGVSSVRSPVKDPHPKRICQDLTGQVSVFYFRDDREE